LLLLKLLFVFVVTAKYEEGESGVTVLPWLKIGQRSCKRRKRRIIKRAPPLSNEHTSLLFVQPSIPSSNSPSPPRARNTKKALTVVGVQHIPFCCTEQTTAFAGERTTRLILTR
jgi:hypothetical protein